MKLTQEQSDFFKDLDLDKAIACGEGRVQFDFTHKDRAVDVRAYSSGKGDIIVCRGTAEEDRLLADRNLSLLDIEGTENMSGPAMLQMLHDAANNPGPGPLKEIWLSTPSVKEWLVDVLGSRIRFSCQEGSAAYELWAHKAQEIQDTTVVELMPDGERVHTFLLPMGYRKPTAQFVLKLAAVITEAWYDEVRSARHE